MLRRPTRSSCVLLLAACGQRPAPSEPGHQISADERVAIVAAETGSTGIKLVAISENGDRQFDLLTSASARDLHPAVSPDGKTVVFASTRDRAEGTSLWIAPLGVEQPPRRLTDDAGIDTHPVWHGTTIVFASTRDGGDFDLWSVVPGEPPVQLTSGAEHEVTPSIARDGNIVYAAVDRTTRASRIEERAPDGTIRQVTPGPDERDPSVSPDGEHIAFVSKATRDGERADAELWIMRRRAGEAKQLVNLPPTDESGPVWSRDGRYVFATSILPGAHEQPVFASVVFVDRTESPPRVRVLRDSAGALVRVTPAIATTSLDATALRRDPEYLSELAKVMAAAIAKQRMQK